MSRKKVIIDTDAGTDDAQALLMALAFPELADVVAVTTVFGTASLDNTTNNVLRVLNLCDRLDVPVYPGCSTTVLGNSRIKEGYHGEDGLGDVPELYPTGRGVARDEHAASALVKLADMYPGELTLLTLGPLTNVASALKLDPLFGKNLKEIFIMGGNTTGQGNITPCAEFNFYNDPEAASLVLNHIHNEAVNLVPLELCIKHSFSWEWYEKFINRQTEKAKFVKTIEEHIVLKAQRRNVQKHYCWDQLAAAVALDASVITGTQDVYATVELGGTYTRGQVVLDLDLLLEKEVNVKVITDIDDVRYEEMLYAAIGSGNA